MAVTDKVTVRIGAELMRRARSCLPENVGRDAADGQILRAGLYALMELPNGQRAEMVRRAELRRGWPTGKEGTP